MKEIRVYQVVEVSWWASLNKTVVKRWFTTRKAEVLDGLSTCDERNVSIEFIDREYLGHRDYYEMGRLENVNELVDSFKNDSYKFRKG